MTRNQRNNCNCLASSDSGDKRSQKVYCCRRLITVEYYITTQFFLQGINLYNAAHRGWLRQSASFSVACRPSQWLHLLLPSFTDLSGNSRVHHNRFKIWHLWVVIGRFWSVSWFIFFKVCWIYCHCYCPRQITCLPDFEAVSSSWYKFGV